MLFCLQFQEVSYHYQIISSTDLAFELRLLGVDAIIIFGLATEICVASTARDAVANGFLTAIVEDARYKSSQLC